MISLNELTPISTTCATLAIGGACITSIVASRLKDFQHQLMVIFFSLMVIGFLDYPSLIILVLISSFSFFSIRKFKERKILLNSLGWSVLALLMVYKFLQVYWVDDAGSSSLPLLMGYSYYTFRISSTLFDASRKTLPSIQFMDYMTYCLFFPIFAGGPIQRYQAFTRNQASWQNNFMQGSARIFIGVIKKLFIADLMLNFLITWLKSQLFHENTFLLLDGSILNTAFSNPLLLSDGLLPVILFGFLNILRAYFDLSAFTDLALGSSKLLGYDIMENFNKPLSAVNIISFWRRWHMSIAGWARDYIFSPLLFQFRNSAIAIFLTMVAIGLWHTMNAQWLLWGVMHGVGLIVCGGWQRIKPKINARLNLDSHFNWIWNLNPSLDTHPGSIQTLYLKKSASTAAQALLNATAWTLNFSYMSLVFVLVSTEDLSEALKIYSLIF